MYNVHMKELKFEWDSRKDKANAKKHGVSFEEARSVFFDEYAIQFYDPDHSGRRGSLHSSWYKPKIKYLNCMSLL